MRKLSTGFEDIPADVREQMDQRIEAQNQRLRDNVWDLYYTLLAVTEESGGILHPYTRHEAERVLARIEDRDVDPDVQAAYRAEQDRRLAAQDQLKLPGVAA